MTKKRFFSIILLFGICFWLMDSLIANSLERGLYQYYGIGAESTVALVGHSHLMLGVDKNRLEVALDETVSKYTREGVNVGDRYYMVMQLLRHNPKLKTVIYGVDAWTFTGEGLSANSHKLFYPFLDDASIKRYVKSKDNPWEFWGKVLIKTSRYNEQLIAGAFRGFLGKWDNLKFGTVDVTKLDQELAKGEYRRINNQPENIKLFQETLEILVEQGITVKLVYIPTIDKLTEVQEEAFTETMALFEAATSEQVQFINLQEPYCHDYSLFYDPIHLNPKGQALITEALVTQLNQR